jgi:hypothetical protein
MYLIFILSYVNFSGTIRNESLYGGYIRLDYSPDYTSFWLMNPKYEKSIKFVEISYGVPEEGKIKNSTNTPNSLGVVGTEFVAGSFAGFLWSEIFFPAPSSKTWYYIPEVAGGYSLFVGPTVWLTGKLMGREPSLIRTSIGAFAGGVLASFFIPHREEEYSFKKYWYYEMFPVMGAVITDEIMRHEHTGLYTCEFVVGSGVSLLHNFGSYTAIYGNSMASPNLFIESARRLPGDVLLTATSVHYSAKMFGFDGNLKNAMIGSVIGSLVSTTIFLLLQNKNPPDWTENDFVEYSGAIAWSIAPAVGAIIGNHWK